MYFHTDKQTMDDLNIFSKPGRDSIYTVFNQTQTRGGAEILEQMFQYPLADADAINTRSRSIQYFSETAAKFPFDSAWFDSAELYLRMEDERTRLPREETMGEKARRLLAKDHDYNIISNGVAATIDILQALHGFLERAISGIPVLQELSTLLKDHDLAPVIRETPGKKFGHSDLARYDDLLRFRSRQTLRRILHHIYTLDVYVTVGKVAHSRRFVFPQAVDRPMHMAYLEEVYHPLVKNAVPNTLRITPEGNVIFLTGANMAGKSTFMKSLGIAMYLAHMGFPVAAAKMEFSVRDGIYTTINLSDDLSAGNSHFYAEVLRVKKVAQALAEAKSLFIIFDELFRGTNVKDACEATIAITEAFAMKRNCMFVISTHIIEAGEVLKERCGNIQFTYLPTTMSGNKPVYSYKLMSGITADRHGMVIINNEGILDIINKNTGS